MQGNKPASPYKASRTQYKVNRVSAIVSISLLIERIVDGADCKFPNHFTPLIAATKTADSFQDGDALTDARSIHRRRQCRMVVFICHQLFDVAGVNGKPLAHCKQSNLTKSFVTVFFRQSTDGFAHLWRNCNEMRVFKVIGNKLLYVRPLRSFSFSCLTEEILNAAK